jgi:hypothetical protein
MQNAKIINKNLFIEKIIFSFAFCKIFIVISHLEMQNLKIEKS